MKWNLVGLVCAAALVCVSASAPAIADTQDDTANLCARASGQESIDACAWVMQSGKWQGENLAWAYYDRAIAYNALGKKQLAVADYSEAIRLKPAYADALGNRAIIYANWGRADDAIADYNRALLIRPDPIDFANRGDAFRDKKDFSRAIQDYTQAIELKPDFAFAYYRRSLAKRESGDTAGADADKAKALALDPSLPN